MTSDDLARRTSAAVGGSAAAPVVEFGRAPERETVEDIPSSSSTVRQDKHAIPVVRARITYSLLWITVGIVTVLLGLVVGDEVTGRDWTRFKDLFTLVLTPFLTLLGTALGFYFANILQRESK